jgi:hypothetical protein
MVCETSFHLRPCTCSHVAASLVHGQHQRLCHETPAFRRLLLGAITSLVRAYALYKPRSGSRLSQRYAALSPALTRA